MSTMKSYTGDAEASSPVRVGEILVGKYRIDQVLGVGGMGIVVAATHIQLDQRVAIKFMLPEALEHPKTVERFAREARAAVKLRSDHVARVLDVGTLDTGSPYMVMEYLEGRDLATLLDERKTLPVDEAVDYVLQACDAIAEAHALGIIHRDLKPRNLFVTRRNDGTPLVKVLDFGISKMSGPGDDLSLTATQEVIGSPNYMSPEQLRSARLVDERGDMWSLGVILYELLSGVLPFEAESVTQLTVMVLQDQPRPLVELRAGIPEGLERVVFRCLEKDPARRVQNVAELAEALGPFTAPQSRDLAQKIARIAAGTGPRSMPNPPISARVHVSGGTSVSWSERTELQPTAKRKKSSRVPLVVSVAVGAAALVVIAVVVVVRALTTPSPTIATQPLPSASSVARPAEPLPSASVAFVEPHPAATVAVAPSASASSKTPQKPPAAGGVSPVGAGRPDDPPKYRTPW
jgi:serine/threonine-protein kinase